MTLTPVPELVTIVTLTMKPGKRDKFLEIYSELSTHTEKYEADIAYTNYIMLSETNPDRVTVLQRFKDKKSYDTIHSKTKEWYTYLHKIYTEEKIIESLHYTNFTEYNKPGSFLCRHNQDARQDQNG